MSAIEVHNLSRHFGAFRAVDDISFEVKPGEVFGFLGANGAGKTTTIRMLCGILAPTAGSASVGGFNVLTETEELKLNIGYMSQRFSLYDDLTVGENIRFFGGIYRLEKSELVERARWIIGMAGLQGKEKTLTSTLSGGWKQRLALGCAVIHQPKILFLDEPTAGVDPISRLEFWRLIDELAGSGVTVLVTTHYMDEAEHCNRLTLMDSGKIVAQGSPAELKLSTLQGTLFEVRGGPFANVQEGLRGMGLEYVEPFGRKFHALAKNGHDFSREARTRLTQGGCAIENIEVIKPSLEDVFLAVIGRTG